MGALIIFPTSEQYKDDRALDAGVVYPMLKSNTICQLDGTRSWARSKIRNVLVTG
jgi:hypothetical protein